MCHWWMANKTQNGRGTTTVTGIPDFPTLDVRALTARQLADAEAAFRALGAHRFLPFNQLAEDPARAELDRVLLEEVLGLPATLREPMQRLRLKLASEPQIHGGRSPRSYSLTTGNGRSSCPSRKPTPPGPASTSCQMGSMILDMGSLDEPALHLFQLDGDQVLKPGLVPLLNQQRPVHRHVHRVHR